VGKQRKKTRRDVAEIARENLEQIIGEKLTGEPLDKPEPPGPDTRNPHAVAGPRLLARSIARSCLLFPRAAHHRAARGDQHHGRFQIGISYRAELRNYGDSRRKTRFFLRAA